MNSFKVIFVILTLFVYIALWIYIIKKRRDDTALVILYLIFWGIFAGFIVFVIICVILAVILLMGWLININFGWIFKAYILISKALQKEELK